MIVKHSDEKFHWMFQWKSECKLYNFLTIADYNLTVVQISQNDK